MWSVTAHRMLRLSLVWPFFKCTSAARMQAAHRLATAQGSPEGAKVAQDVVPVVLIRFPSAPHLTLCWQLHM